MERGDLEIAELVTLESERIYKLSCRFVCWVFESATGRGERLGLFFESFYFFGFGFSLLTVAFFEIKGDGEDDKMRI